MLYVWFFNVDTRESLKHLGLRSPVYLEKELAASIVCWLGMLNASNIVNILLLQQITLLNFPGKSLLCMKNGCTLCTSKSLTDTFLMLLSKISKGKDTVWILRLKSYQNFSLGYVCWVKHITTGYSAWTRLVCQMKT